MKKLYDLYEESTGKISDKWNIYFDAYDNIMAPYRNKPITMLEIGVQNGGSLEAWSNYFSQAEKIIGCDIDELCGNLTYTDPRISVFVGDATSDVTSQKIISFQPEFDIVIDDGSHTSPDIIRAFCKYFGTIKNGGVFIAEDLHCSYWGNYEGGIYHPYSSISFFKRLVDIINHEHWGLDKASGSVLDEFKEHYQVEIDNELLSQIHSVEFINSICVIRKKEHEQNILGERYIAGEEESVVVGNKNYHKTFLNSPPQNDNIWSTMLHSPAAQWLELNDKLAADNEKQEQLTLEHAKIIAQLESEKNKNRSLVDENTQLHSTLDLHDIDITHLKEKVSHLEHSINEIWNSRSWKLTKPVRWFFTNLRRFKRLMYLIRPALRQGGGITQSFKKGLTIYKNEGMSGLKSRLHQVSNNAAILSAHSNYSEFESPISQAAEKIYKPRILIIGELSIPQCKKYRVQQKKEMFLNLGYECKVLSWNHTQECLDALQTSSLVIFYRVPAFEGVLKIINEANRLNIKKLWDVDDLIFDAEILKNSKTLQTLDANVFDGLISGAKLYKEAMLSCDYGIASTPGLAIAMKSAGLNEVFIVENALDLQTVNAAEGVNSAPASQTKQDPFIRIVYGSGTSTHNIDFEEAAPAIAKILSSNKQVKLRIIGQLRIPAYLEANKEQLEFFPTCTYEEYLVLLSECDISIAPLENYIFNDSKSNIKYIEASSLKIPSVCSPRSAFTQAIEQGKNGFLADNADEWEQSLQELISSQELRNKMGNLAYHNVHDNYSPDNIGHKQLMKIINELFIDNSAMSVLSVNCYYKPRPFGGATIVAEALNKNLTKSGCNINVVTAFATKDIEAYKCKRYETDGVNVFGIGLPHPNHPKKVFENSDINAPFEEILELVKPAIVHFHSIQGMGISMLETCFKKNIPYVVTLHDAWWVSQKQFISCDNVEKDTPVVPSAGKTTSFAYSKHLDTFRDSRLRYVLENAECLLSPSNYSARFYKSNKFENIIVNKNGVNVPHLSKHTREGSTLRFGYVGGNTPIKGFNVIQHAFSKNTGKDIQLTIADNTTNLGYSSFSQDDISFYPDVKLVPGYTQDTIDQFFASIDVLLFPTQVMESFGLTVREALIRNVWVITTDAGGVTEDIIEGENGFIIPLEDKGEALLAAINKTVAIYSERYAHGEVVLPGNTITTFDQQAVELQGIFDGIISAKNPD